MNFVELFRDMEPVQQTLNPTPDDTYILNRTSSENFLFSQNWGPNCPVFHYSPTTNTAPSKQKPPPAKNGIFFSSDLILPPESDEFAAVFGGTASGKTAVILKNTLFKTWRNSSFCALDIKGDIAPEYEKSGNPRKAVVLSLRKELQWTYDPLDHVRRGDEEDKIANIEELVNALIPLPVNVKEPFWISSERCLVAAGTLFFYNMGMDFISIMVTIMTTPPADLIKAIAESGDEEAKTFINQFIKKTYDEETDTTIITVNCDSKMLVCVGQGITNKLKIFATNPRIQRVLAPSDNQVIWDELDDYNVFISVPENRLEQYGGILSMIITQLIRTMERRPDMWTTEGRRCKHTLIALDEFARLGKMDIIADSVSTLRSKKVKFLLLMQSIAQLDRIYGRETRRVILENMGYIAILRVNDAESQRYFSDLVGTRPVERISHTSSIGGDPYSTQTSTSHEPTIRPHEFASLKDIVVVTPDPDDGVVRVEKEFYHDRAAQEL